MSNDIRRRETEAHKKSDAELGKRVSEAAGKAGGWFSGVLDKLAEIGSAGSQDRIKMASARAPQAPAMVPQMPAVAGHHFAAPTRDVRRVADELRAKATNTRSVENAVARAQEMLSEAAANAKLGGAKVMFLKADVSRWDDRTGQPMTGRLAFQIPFASPHGDPRTVYANVDIVMGSVMPPRHFQDGLNNRYAFDAGGVSQLLEGTRFDVLQNPRSDPETAYRGPDMFPPSGIPSSVAGSRGGLLLRRTSAGEITRQASIGAPPRHVAEGFVRSVSQDQIEAQAQTVSLPPTSPEVLKKRQTVRTPSDAQSIYPSGREETHPAVGDLHGGSGQTPAASTMAGVLVQVMERRAAGAWDKAVAFLRRNDMRMVNFGDLIQYLKQQGQEKDLSFAEAAKKLMPEGIVLYQTAGSDRMAAASVGMLIRMMAMDSRKELTAADGQGAPPDFEINRYLEPVEYKEYEALLDKWESLWKDIQGRERQNLEQGREPHATIDYSEVQILADQIKAVQNLARQRHDTEGMPAPADVAIDDQTSGAEPIKPSAPAAGPGPSIAPATLTPEKGMGVPAASADRIRRRAGAADVLGDRAKEVGDLLPKLKDQGHAAPGEKGGGRGRQGYPDAGLKFPELARGAAALEMTDEVKTKMIDAALDPANPEHQTRFLSEVKKVTAAQSLDFPEVCKNCKWMVTPASYSPLSEFRSDRLPICGAPKTPGVGFEFAAFRECRGYDPVAKGIPQKIETNAPASRQTPADVEKVKVPIKKKAASEMGEGSPAEDVETLLADLQDFMGAFAFEDSEPIHIGEGVPGEEEKERQMAQLVDQAALSKDPSDVQNALGQMSSFLELFPNPDAEILRQRVAEFLARSGGSDVSFEEEQMPEKVAAALPSADADVVRSRPAATGKGAEVREWCKKNGHYAEAGKHHPTHDWCTLWNTACDNVVLLPSGAGIPASLAAQSSESQGEGGPHQFGRSPNQGG